MCNGGIIWWFWVRWKMGQILNNFCSSTNLVWCHLKPFQLISIPIKPSFFEISLNSPNFKFQRNLGFSPIFLNSPALSLIFLPCSIGIQALSLSHIFLSAICNWFAEFLRLEIEISSCICDIQGSIAMWKHSSSHTNMRNSVKSSSITPNHIRKLKNRYFNAWNKDLNTIPKSEWSTVKRNNRSSNKNAEINVKSINQNLFITRISNNICNKQAKRSITLILQAKETIYTN